MSYDLVVYLQRSNMPTPAAWHSSIVAAGFPVTLDTDFDVGGPTASGLDGYVCEKCAEFLVAQTKGLRSRGGAALRLLRPISGLCSCSWANHL